MQQLVEVLERILGVLEEIEHDLKCIYHAELYHDRCAPPSLEHE